MRYSAKLLGLVGATAIMLPVIQIPKFFAEPWNLVPAALAQDQTLEAEAARLLQQGFEQFNVNQFDAALESWQQALELYQNLENAGGQGLVYWGIGRVSFQKGQYSEALEHYQQALSLFRDPAVQAAYPENSRSFEGAVLNNIGEAYTSLADRTAALTHYQQALAIYQSLEDQPNAAANLSQIGALYSGLEQYPQALEAYQQAVTLYQAIENHAEVGLTFYRIGELYRIQEQYTQAVEAYQQAATAYQQANSPYDQAHSLHWLGSAYQNLEQYPQSLAAYQQALVLYQGLESLSNIAYTTENIGDIILISYQNIAMSYGDQQNYPAAITAWQQALDVLNTYQERLTEAKFLENRMDILGQLGIAYQNHSQYAESIQAHQESAEIAGKLGDFAEQVQQLSFMATGYNRLNQYEQAIATSEQALKIVRDQIPQDRDAEMGLLINLGQTYDSLGQYDRALEHYQQALDIAKDLKDLGDEISLLNNIGTVYGIIGQYLQALEPLQQAWELNQAAIAQLEIEGVAAVEPLCDETTASLGARSQQHCLDRFRYQESGLLNNLGCVYNGLGRYSEALEAYQKALVYHQENQNQYDEMTALGNIGNVYAIIGDYAKAIDFHQQALQIARAINSRSHEAHALSNLGYVYVQQGQYFQALEHYQQGLLIARDISEPSIEATILGNMGTVYYAQGKLTEALSHYQSALEIRQRLGETIITDLNNIALVYDAQGQIDQALGYFQQSLEIARNVGARTNEATTLSNIAGLYAEQADYAKALELQQQASSLLQELGGSSNQWSALAGLGQLYFRLGQYDQALDYYQQALQISRQTGEKLSEASSLSFLGVIYWRQEQLDLALEQLQASLRLTQEMGDIVNESRVLASIGRIYQQQGKPDQAVVVLEQALKNQREVGVRPDEGGTLTVLGLAYGSQGHLPEATATLQQAIVIHQETGDLAAEAKALANLGEILTETQPEVAIVFYKQSVNVREGIRGGLGTLPQDLQQAYTDSVADDYRALADLLLEQGRIPEAQQVLDLLKLEELREFTHNRAAWTDTQLQHTDPEQAVIDAHGSLIALGQKIYACEQTSCATLNSLHAQLEPLTQQYNQQVEQFKATVRDNRADDDNFADPDNLSGDAEDLLAANPNALLIYPFVTDTKLWLLWAAGGGVVGSIEVDVAQGDLARTVQRFGELLQSGGDLAELQATSQQLYGWLIQPLEASLAANEIQQLIFVNDRVTRYIPMAALYDGEQYLIERYTLSTVLSPALTDTEERLGAIDQSQVLGLGLTQTVADFPSLPAVEAELDAIVRSQADDPTGIYPGQVYLNDDFTLERLKENIFNYRVLHMATHAAFMPGQPEDSFILLGNGEEMQMADINTMGRQLRNLHLVVLSACQTALGGETGDGTEIAGLSSYFLATGRAKTVIASLWKVNDDSTSILMQRFYELLATGELTKAEALRQAQLSLLYDEDTETRLVAVRSPGGIEVVSGDRSDPTPTDSRHPYYWAPFILIGNGL